jgi:hypothetical protein
MWGHGGIWSLRLRAALALAAHYRSMADKALAEKDHARWLRTAGRRSTFLQGFGEAAESVLYTFDLLMLRGKDVRSWAIEERRGRLLEIAQQLPPSIRYSETVDAPLPELIKAVRQHQLEGDRCQARGQSIPLRGAVQGLAKMAGQSRSGARHRRLHSK